MRAGEKPKRVLPRRECAALRRNASLGSGPEHGFGGGSADVGVTPGLARVAGEVLGGEGSGDLALRPTAGEGGDAEGHICGGGSARISHCGSETREGEVRRSAEPWPEVLPLLLSFCSLLLQEAFCFQLEGLCCGELLAGVTVEADERERMV